MVTKLEHQMYIMVEKLEAEESSWFLELQESRMKGKTGPLMALPSHPMWASAHEMVLPTLPASVNPLYTCPPRHTRGVPYFSLCFQVQSST